MSSKALCLSLLWLKVAFSGDPNLPPIDAEEGSGPSYAYDDEDFGEGSGSAEYSGSGDDYEDAPTRAEHTLSYQSSNGNDTISHVEIVTAAVTTVSENNTEVVVSESEIYFFADFVGTTKDVINEHVKQSGVGSSAVTTLYFSISFAISSHILNNKQTF